MHSLTLVYKSKRHPWPIRINPNPNLRLRKEKPQTNLSLHAPEHTHTHISTARCPFFFYLCWPVCWLSRTMYKNGKIV